MDWKGAIEYVGLPCLLKDAHGGGWRDVYVCRSVERCCCTQRRPSHEVLQDIIEWDKYIRCLCSDKRSTADAV